MIKFKFDPRIKNGYYSASYFNKSTHIVKKYKPNENVCLQFVHFTNKLVKVCGISESVQMLQAMLTKQELKQIQVYGVTDGDLVNGRKPVLLIIGPYQLFGKYENVIDGILARRSSVANNCYQMLRLIKSSQLVYMADRTDDYLLQPYDGYAAYIGGVRNFVTDASVELIKHYKNISVTGTIPHALIQEFDGDLNGTMRAYINEFGSSKSIALIDYHNDVVSEIKKLSLDFKNLFAVRVDTSNNLIDKGLLAKYRNVKSAYGVSPQLIELTRKTLDNCGMKNTKVVASSGIDNEKILNFQKHKSPIDYYGVGSSLITRNVHFTADLVLKNGHHEAKYGRELFININRIKTLKKYI
ncbi:MAG: nicotinate phosphoribosyltransferase [Mycoplasmataceae bacterium]|jgi:nicotinate phosphoribosyltransferase|nr:nicotinate phosphoribosyltransferase [Mycoplasmataceae bacterium]